VNPGSKGTDGAEGTEGTEGTEGGPAEGRGEGRVKLPPAPVRRAVLDPVWPLIAAALAALFLVVAAVGALAWPLDRRVRAPRLALLATLYLFLDVSLLVSCGALWLRHPVEARRDDERWQRAHAGLLRWALATLMSAATPLLGFSLRLEEPPDAARLSDDGPVLVLARHAGPGDSFTLVELLLSRYHRIPRIVLKETLQWDPGLDVLLNRLSACFLPTRSAAGEDLPGRLAELAATLHGHDAMLIFPEGRNWTPRRYLRALARLRRQGLRRRALRQAAADAADNPNVLPPRPAGVLACLAARPDLDVVVIAHTGLEDLVNPALVWRALPLGDRPMTVRWWYEAARTIPASPDDQYQWLRIQWSIVDSWIGARKAQQGEPGQVPSPGVAAADADPDDRDVDPLLGTPG
jgi:1-acyl-sn-glycerol-3-phosphate acyltransferase